MHRRRSLLSGCVGLALIGLTPAVPANAQPVTSKKARTSAAGRPKPATAPGSQPDTSEIIVTAQKRPEVLLNVPISISVLTPAVTDRANESVSELLRRVPGLAVSKAVQGAGTQLTVRGVSATGPYFNGSTPVAYYLDTAAFGFVRNAVAPDSNAYDLDRVEVLRGPQGTLYGASALNGVVRVLTHDADLDKFELKTRVSLSSTYKGGINYRGDAAINIPLIEHKLAVRTVLGFDHGSGWIDRVFKKNANVSNIKTLRVKVNAAPTDRLTIGLSAWISRDKHEDPDQGDFPYNSTAIPALPFTTNYEVYGGKIAYDAGAFTVTSSTGYINFRNTAITDFTPFLPPGFVFTQTTHNRSKAANEEVVANSNGNGPWRWSVGASYRHVKDHVDFESLLTIRTDLTDTSKAYAIFGEITRELFDDKLELTGGLRYFHDDVALQENYPSNGIVGTPLVHAAATFKKVTPRVVLTYKPSRNLTFYASYSQGFRSGTEQFPVVVAANPNFPPARPDTLTNYEIGSKGRLFGGLVNYDAALYYISWKDVQLSTTILIGPLPYTAIVNGPKASGVGTDLSLYVHPTLGLDVGGNLSVNSLKIDNTILSGGTVLFDKGDRLNNSAKATIGGFLNYVTNVGSAGYKLRFNASVNHTSRLRYALVLARKEVGYGDPLTIARVNVALDSPKGWSASLFVDNLTNEHGVVLFPFGVNEYKSRVRPRTIGLQFEYKL